MSGRACDGRAVVLALTLASLGGLAAPAAGGQAPAGAESGLARTETSPREGQDRGIRGFFLGGGEQRGPITIDARRFEVDNRRRTASYTEQVVARQDDTTLTADRLTVTFGEAQRISQVTAEGSVRIVQKAAAPGALPTEREATCARVVFMVAEDRVVCSGTPASMRQGEDLIRGSRITVWVVEERIVVEGDSASPRVTSRITPKPAAPGQAGQARPN